MKTLALRLRAVALLAVLAAAVVNGGRVWAEERFITLASTTSTQNSGLFEHILPQFRAASGIEVRVVAVGTGQALRLGEKGDADVVFVHHRPSEDAFVAEGFGVRRDDVMYNDFVIVGPAADPAGVRQGKDVLQALASIARAQAAFISRGDDSGTHKLERALWADAGVDVTAASGGWYREAGAGMGPTLNIASGLGGYALTDRGTWVSFRNKGALAIVSAGDPRLFNPYGVILVNPAKHPHVKAADGQAFIDWLVSAAGQQAIASFTVEGEQLFYPNAAKAGR